MASNPDFPADCKPPSAELSAALRLALTPGLSPLHLCRLYERQRTATAVLAAGPATWRECASDRGRAAAPELRRAVRAVPDAAVTAAARLMQLSGARLVVWTDAGYPRRLREIHDPPAQLFVRGAAVDFDVPAIAIVGARQATPAGVAVARRLGAELARAGCSIVSGLARGIDGAAHAGALDVGGVSVAVAACGVERIYPRRHAHLADALMRDGVLLSEFAPGTVPLPRHFPRRNRIIAGLSLGVVVVEAAARSGSLITARFALEQGRDVFAVPGAVTNPLARGCHLLLRDGAALVESAHDVIAELAPQLAGELSGTPESPTRAPASSTGAPSSAAQRVLQALAGGPASDDVLVSHTGMSPSALLETLCSLELTGRVARADGGAWMSVGEPSLPVNGH